MNESTSYIPGMCNINPAEIKRRRQSGYFSLGVAALGLGLFLYLHASWPYFLVLFMPLYIGVLGLLQARSKFCVAFASAGKQHADDESDVTSVTDAESKKIDQLKARTMYLKALAITLPLTALLCLIPLLYS